MKLLLSLLLAFSVLGAKAPSDFVSDISIRDANLVYGGFVTFDVRFPQEAARNARHPQFEEAPIIQIDCRPYATGTLDYLAQTWTEDRTKVTGGWVGYTYSRPFNSHWPRDGRKWLSGGASCVAYLASFAMRDGRLVTTIWDSTRFEVGA